MTVIRLISSISHVELIASSVALRDRAGLSARFGKGRWRKMKGRATMELEDGRIIHAEVHWYDAHRIGRRLLKFKRTLE